MKILLSFSILRGILNSYNLPGLACTPPSGYTGDHDLKYKLYNTHQTFYNAWTQCQSDGANLATIKTVGENMQFLGWHVDELGNKKLAKLIECEIQKLKIRIGTTGDDFWFGMTNYDEVDCASSSECDQSLMWIDGTTYYENVLAMLNPQFDVDNNNWCLKYKMTSFSGEIASYSCTASLKFVCQYDCNNPLSIKTKS